jgi:hypothetical protein
MDIQPSDSQYLISIESRLEAGDLTLGEIRDIEDEILLSPEEKTKKIGERIFSRMEGKRRSLIQREIVRLEGKDDIGSKVLKMKLLNVLEEPDGEALEILREVPLEEDVQVQKMVLGQLEEIRFAAAHPIVLELDDGALGSNFVSRVRRVARAMVEQNSITPFQGLSGVQQGEVMRYAGRGK